MATWDKVVITGDAGEQVQAIAPIIISASRSTDIPARDPGSFMQQLKRGYMKWVNPFNHITQYVSFQQTRVIVFWTKNAAPMLSHLKQLDSRNIHYYFQYTLNDYEAECLEPGLPPLSARIDTFIELSEMIGPEKVIWRFDPLILVKNLTIRHLLEKINRIGSHIHCHTKKLVFSFADIDQYAAVRKRLLSQNYQNFDQEKMSRFARGLQELNKNWHLELATCAEPIDLSIYGVKHNRCIDDELLMRLFPDDRILAKFLGFVPDRPGDFFPGSVQSGKNLKDKGQRKACGCIMSKDIGGYKRCDHGCLYCYANPTIKKPRVFDI